MPLLDRCAQRSRGDPARAADPLHPDPGSGSRYVSPARQQRALVVQPRKGDTDMFIVPGYQFRVVDGLMTNFHLPRTTLLMLVSAFTGLERLREAYHEAVRARYRFYSYGDAMLIL